MRTSHMQSTQRMAPVHKLPWSMPVSRDEFLVDCCRARRVLHLACASAPFTRRLDATGQLLHGKLNDVTGELVGVDIDQDALDYMRGVGLSRLHHANLLDMADIQRLRADLPWSPEVIVAGELIEHLDQPGVALRHFAALMDADCELVLTVPNAFALKSFLRVLLGKEKVAADHVAYFSLLNLKELVGRAGLRVETVRWYRSSFARNVIERSLDVLLWPALAMRPQISDGIIVVCRRDPESQQVERCDEGAPVRVGRERITN